MNIEISKLSMTYPSGKIALREINLQLNTPTADVRQLVEVLQRFVDNENTVVVIEHNLDVIKTADRLSAAARRRR